MRKDIVHYFNQKKLICTELQTTWKISYSISATKCVVLRKRIIEDNRRKSESSDILGRARKKFAFVIGLKMTPGSDLAQNLFQIWKWFRLARFGVFLCVCFLFCFLCGNKINLLQWSCCLPYIHGIPYTKNFFPVD